ncbi:MAG: histidine phosphatase family protein [Ilumatobacteraceae bacterium]
MSEPDPPSATTSGTRLVLVRHGESQVTVRRVVGGIRSCTGLSALGRAQVDSLARRLEATREIDAGALYTSAYPRAVETAEQLRAALGAEVRVEDGFGEHDPGPECDGLTFDEFVDRYGMPDWESEPFGTTFPGGETLAAFQHRVGATLHDVLERHAGATIVVVCHGGVIDAILRTALRTVSSGLFELHTTNASLTELVRPRPGRWRLVRYNDAAHLADVTDVTDVGT